MSQSFQPRKAGTYQVELSASCVDMNGWLYLRQEVSGWSVQRATLITVGTQSMQKNQVITGIANAGMICSTFNQPELTAVAAEQTVYSNREETALRWAQKRKKDNETVVIASCPCCSNLIAIYVEQTARQEAVPHTTDPKHQALPATQDSVDNQLLWFRQLL